jgi:hypothetical protein
MPMSDGDSSKIMVITITQALSFFIFQLQEIGTEMAPGQEPEQHRRGDQKVQRDLRGVRSPRRW